MWSYNRAGQILAVGLLVVLAGCGFRPLYWKGSGATSAEMGAIKIDPISDRSGQILRNHLLDKLNPIGSPTAPRYTLKVKLTEAKRELAIRVDEVATRANLTFNAAYTLVDPGGRILNSGTARATASYNILRDDFATISSEKNARARGMIVLSQEIQTRIEIFLNRRHLFPNSVKPPKTKSPESKSKETSPVPLQPIPGPIKP